MSRTAVVVACLLITGCGSGAPPKSEQYPVTGKLTVDGKPIKGYTVSFVSIDSTTPVGFSGVTDESGTYSLSDQKDGSEGAFVGKYKVVLAQSPEAAKEAMMKGGAKQGYASGADDFAKEYWSAETSPKQVEVKAESNVIDLNL